MAGAVARELRRRERAMAEATGQSRPVDPDDPSVVAIGEYRALRRKLTEMPNVKRKMVELDGGRTFEVREMTYGEFLEVQEKGDALPFAWPLEQQCRDVSDLHGLGASEVRLLAEEVYRLTYTEPEAPEAPEADEAEAEAAAPSTP